MFELHSTVYHKDMAGLEAYLQAYPESLNSKGWFGWGDTALYWAAFSGNVEATRFLLEKGADFRLTGTFGWGSWGYSPWEIALHYKHFPVLLELSRVGARENIVPEKIQALLEESIKNWDEPGIQFLLKEGASIASFYSHTTLLHEAVERHSYAIIKSILDERVLSVDAVDAIHRTPLMLAVQLSDKFSIDLLLSYFPNKEIIDKNGQNILHYIAESGDVSLLERFYGRHSFLEAQDNLGCTPLMIAAKHGKAEVVGWIIDHLVKLNITDHNQQTALHIALQQGHSYIAYHLLQYGALANLQDKHGHTPLMLAAKNNLDFVVQELLATYHVSVNIMSHYGQTALMVASKNGNFEIVKMLLEYGASVHLQDHEGYSAISLAHQNYHPEVVRLLCDWGADCSNLDLARMDVKRGDALKIEDVLLEDADVLFPGGQALEGTDPVYFFSAPQATSTPSFVLLQEWNTSAEIL